MPAGAVAPAKARPRPVPRSKPEIRTNTPDGIKGFTKTPYEYDHLVTGNKLSGLLQASLVYWIGRHTWGNEKRPEWARLSLTALAKLCGGVERKSVAIALADLIKRGIVAAADRQGCGATTAKMYKLTPEKWKTAKPYTPPTPAEESEAADDAAAEDDEEIAASGAHEAPERIAQPGRASRPQPVAMQLKGAAEPVKIRVVYHSDFDQPLLFRTRPGLNGLLDVRVSRPEGEDRAKRCSSPRLQSFANHSPSADANKQLADYRPVISAIVLQIWQKAADDQLIAAVVAAAGPAPVALFQHHVHLKFKSRADAARFHSPALLPLLAADALKTHLAMNQRPPADPPELAQPAEEPLNPTRRWDRIRAAIKTRVSATVYANWFAHTRQIEEGKNTTTVGVFSPEQAGFMDAEFSALIGQVCSEQKEPGKIIWRAEQ